MVIIKNIGNDENFYPDFNSVIVKKDKYYSSAEMRMSYKLMAEIPDHDIQIDYNRH